MGMVRLENIETGMILADDAIVGGNLILLKGEKILDKHLNIFRQWGLSEANIVGTSNNDLETKHSNKISPELLEIAKRKVTPFFKHANLKFAPTKELCKICILRKVDELKKIAANKKSDDEP